MQIQPIAMVPHNTSAASAQAQASSASFDRMLEEAKRSAQEQAIANARIARTISRIHVKHDGK